MTGHEDALCNRAGVLDADRLCGLATVFANIEDGSQLYATVSIGPDGSVQVDAPQPVPDFGL